MIFLPVQSRMARAALGWGVRDLAARAKVSIDTVVRFERGDALKERTVEALQQVLEREGIEFTNGNQPGVRIAKDAAMAAAAAQRAPRETSATKPARGRIAKQAEKKK
jgi:transcriptional regulator with XRE-family HTH domain